MEFIIRQAAIPFRIAVYVKKSSKKWFSPHSPFLFGGLSFLFASITVLWGMFLLHFIMKIR
jgi:hypothetical protein